MDKKTLSSWSKQSGADRAERKSQHVNSFKDLADDKVEKLRSANLNQCQPEIRKETLTNLDVWSKVQSKVVYSKDVRQVLSYIETGNADAGIVYRTDALSSDQVETVETAKAICIHRLSIRSEL
ncbi:substrate-binding domain-containing protein [Bacillus licheniformis]|nr:substrate-binding domain-containing protein [Bacillus licheniformis]